MEVTHQARWRTAKLSAASLSLLVSLHCNVYSASLLGNGESPGGRGATGGRSGASAAGGFNAASGAAGESELGGADGAGFGGLIGMAGDMEAGGAGASAGSAGHAGGMAGRGGSTGGTGGAGGKGAGGKGAGGAGAGGAGAGGAGAGGAGGASQTVNGCAKLSVPLDAAADKAHFVISLTSPADLSGATLSMRFYVQAGQGGTIFNYVQDSGTFHFLGVATAERPLLSSFSGWSMITWDVGAEPEAGTGIDKTNIKNIGVELNALPSSTWSNPTIVYLDSITVTSPALSFTFDATASVYPTPTTSSASGQALWQNSGASDTTATGVTLSWQATCP
jgi:hypothetical protein